MRVNIYETVDVSDEQRAAIAARLGQKTASRNDLKAFVWEYGSRWDDQLLLEKQLPDDQAEQIAADKAKYDAALAKAHENAQADMDLI